MDVMSPQQWPLVGRDDELSRLLAALARDDVRGVVVVGDAGVGKSRLAAATCARAAEQGMAVERVLGTQAAAAVPLAAFADLLVRRAPGRSARPLPGDGATAQPTSRQPTAAPTRRRRALARRQLGSARAPPRDAQHGQGDRDRP